MTEQTPEPDIDESAVEPEHTTNDLAEQDDAWVDEDQEPDAQPDFGDPDVDLDTEDDDTDGAQ